MKLALKLMIVMVLLAGCDGDEDPGSPTKIADSSEVVKVHFPVLDFIKSEIRFVDSLPVGIMKYTIQNGIIDSSYIPQEEFHRLAQQFVLPALHKETFEKEFSETSFFDNTTQFASMVYSTNNKSLDVQRVDVLAKPEDVVYNKVQSIYIEKHSQNNDSSITEKLYWKAGQNFQITTETQTPTAETITRQIKVVWNPGY